MKFNLFAPDAQKINDVVVEFFQEFLTEFDFSLTEKNVSGFSAHATFTRAENYVYFSLEDMNIAIARTTAPPITEKRWSLVVRIGDGETNFPERLYSSINIKDPGKNDPFDGFYFNNKKTCYDACVQIRDLLNIKHSLFLKGDISLLRQLRRERLASVGPVQIIVEGTRPSINSLIEKYRSI